MTSQAIPEIKKKCNHSSILAKPCRHDIPIKKVLEPFDQTPSSANQKERDSYRETEGKITQNLSPLTPNIST
jgi:hypothetical protein